MELVVLAECSSDFMIMTILAGSHINGYRKTNIALIAEDLNMEKREVRLLKSSGHACRILTHLVRGRTLTTAQAFNLFHCTSLHSRLSELKRRGWKIRSTELKLKSGKRCRQYSI
jgi:hypothetical protein